MTQSFLILPGDGIGPEVAREARRVLDIVAPDIEVSEAEFGGASYDLHGVPLTQDVLARARASDAILMGAVGGPKWAGVPRDKRPEMGLLTLRKELDVYANLRPCVLFSSIGGCVLIKARAGRGARHHDRA